MGVSRTAPPPTELNANSFTAAQLHTCTAAQLHSFTASQLHSCTASQLLPRAGRSQRGTLVTILPPRHQTNSICWGRVWGDQLQLPRAGRDQRGTLCDPLIGPGPGRRRTSTSMCQDIKSHLCFCVVASPLASHSVGYSTDTCCCEFYGCLPGDSPDPRTRRCAQI